MNVSFPFLFWFMCCCSPMGECSQQGFGEPVCLSRELGRHLGHRAVLPFHQPAPGLVSTAGTTNWRFAACVHCRNRCVSGHLAARVLSAIKMWIPWLKGLMRQPKWEHFQKSDFCNCSGFHQKLLILFLCYRVNLLYNENIVKYTTARSV